MFVGEAPGFHEDKQGVPFVGAAGQLLSKLLDGIGLTREDVYIANVLKCRPPGNRDPQPEEIESCEPHLWRKIELIQPKLICTLGNFATKLLSGPARRDHAGARPAAGRRARRQPGDALSDLPSGSRALHAAHAAVLQEDFARIPELLGRAVAPPPPPAEPEPVAVAQPEQLGLF